MIPFLSFDYQDNLYRLEIIFGNELMKFEKEYAKLYNTQYAITIANGLDALII